VRILYVGTPDGTCEHRARALEEEGHVVARIAARSPEGFFERLAYRAGLRWGRIPDLAGVQRQLRSRAGDRWDLLWVDKGLLLAPRLLAEFRSRNPGARLIHYSPDDMFNPANQTARYLAGIGEYDLHVTTKSYNVAELRAAGARDVLFVDNAFDPAAHRPMVLTAQEQARFASGAGFIGAAEPDRERQMRILAGAGVPVSVWGSGWKQRMGGPALDLRGGDLLGDDYARAICATRVNLGFLRKVNRDLQTTRSVEIPACGGFLLAERTEEHLRLFREGVEAEFFSSPDELVRKARHYLGHEDERARIARAGRERCLRDGYDNRTMVRRVLAHSSPADKRDSNG
jgi:hypothetical protein